MAYTRAVFYLVVIAVALATVACDEEEDFSVGESEVTVEAESGTMEFRQRRENENDTKELRPVRIRVTQLVQRDKDGNEATNCSDVLTAEETSQTTATTMDKRRRRRDVQPVVTRQTVPKEPRGPLRRDVRPETNTQGSVDPDMDPYVGQVRPPDDDGQARHDGSAIPGVEFGGGPAGMRNHPWSGMGSSRFSNFARAHFTVEKKRAHQAMNNSRKALKALQKRFHADLGEGVGKMAIDMALPEDDGELEIDGEKQKLRKGDLKFNIELSEWSWCGEEGHPGAAAYLDVYVEVNSTRRPKMRHQRTDSAPASFDLGEDMTMSFSGKFKRDDVWRNVENGYPKVDSDDPNVIIIRFLRFNSKLLYDPTVSAEADDNDNGNGGGKGSASDSSCLGVSAMFVTMTTALTYILLK